MEGKDGDEVDDKTFLHPHFPCQLPEPASRGHASETALATVLNTSRRKWVRYSKLGANLLKRTECILYWPMLPTARIALLVVG